MINIAFCDDDAAVLCTLSDLLDHYRTERKLEYRYTAYQSPLDLLEELERGTKFDILFLDVLMPGQNGIDTAAEIREHDQTMKIIFLTSSSEFAVQSYAVGAYYYQLKPIWADSFFRLLDKVLNACEREQTESLILRSKSGVTRIVLHQLEYCEVIGKTLFFHMASGTIYEGVGNMESISADLIAHGNFFRAHRSYTVNLDYVAEITSRAVVMRSLEEIPLPKGRFAQIRDAFLARAFQEGWEDHGTAT